MLKSLHIRTRPLGPWAICLLLLHLGKLRILFEVQSSTPSSNPSQVVSEEELTYEWLSYMRARKIRWALSRRWKVPASTTKSVVRTLPLRHVDLIRKLWIDAIYINHENLSECIEQVSIMSTTCGQASKVLIWLGSPLMGAMGS
jgi:hypothetical protein